MLELAWPWKCHKTTPTQPERTYVIPTVKKWFPPHQLLTHKSFVSTRSGCGIRPCITTFVSRTRHHGDKVFQRMQTAAKSMSLTWFKKNEPNPCSMRSGESVHQTAFQSCWTSNVLSTSSCRSWRCASADIRDLRIFSGNAFWLLEYTWTAAGVKNDFWVCITIHQPSSPLSLEL